MLNNEVILKLKNGLKSGVTVQVAPQLFETPKELSLEIVDMLDLLPSDKILEPSAGKGSLIRACGNFHQITAIEINYQLCDYLRSIFNESKIICDDFLSLQNDDLGLFDKILMNPPFANGQDIEHITHAFKFLKKGGILVAVVCEGPFFRSDKKSAQFREFLSKFKAEIIKLPEGTFKNSGTMVNTRLVKIINE